MGAIDEICIKSLSNAPGCLAQMPLGRVARGMRMFESERPIADLYRTLRAAG